ncbi:MAG: hypothetical protein QM811_20690 [Pirellulales bacterium]
MTWNEHDIERLVRAALQRIATEVAQPAKPAAANKPANSGEFALSAVVIGTRELADLPGGIRSLAIRRGAVVTPAARDWLREKRISLTSTTDSANSVKRPSMKQSPSSIANVAPSVSTTARSFVVGEAIAKFDAAPFVALLRQRGFAVERLARSGLDTVAAEAAALARDGRRAILFTDKPFAAVVAANRVAGAARPGCAIEAKPAAPRPRST